MIYILIVMWFGQSSSYSGKAAIAVEFNTLANCQAAAAEIRRQSPDTYALTGVVMCAAKGNQSKETK